jgi:hypothetical protein
MRTSIFLHFGSPLTCFDRQPENEIQYVSDRLTQAQVPSMQDRCIEGGEIGIMYRSQAA